MSTAISAATGSGGLLELADLPIDLTGLPGRGTLPAILDGHIRVAHMPGLLRPDYCTAILEALTDVSYKNYSSVQGLAEKDSAHFFKFGPTAHYGFDSEPNGVENYFTEAAEADRELRNRFARANIADPLHVMKQILGHLWGGPADVATEGDRSYFAGVVRSLTAGAGPHTDNAKRTPQLSIGETTAQGSILFYLAMPTEGGGVRVFNKRPVSPEPLDGLGWAGVAGYQYEGVTPTAGDVVIIPTTHVHSVDPVSGEGDRITISAFFGPMPDGRLVLWS